MLVESSQADLRIVFLRDLKRSFLFNWEDVWARRVVLEGLLVRFSPCTFPVIDDGGSPVNSTG